MQVEFSRLRTLSSDVLPHGDFTERRMVDATLGCLYTTADQIAIRYSGKDPR